MNLYNVVLGRARGFINARSYIVAASSEENAVYGDKTRQALVAYLTDWYGWNDEPPSDEVIRVELFRFELPMHQEEIDQCRFHVGKAPRTYEVVLLASDLANPYEEGEVLCCDYRDS